MAFKPLTEGLRSHSPPMVQVGTAARSIPTTESTLAADSRIALSIGISPPSVSTKAFRATFSAPWVSLGVTGFKRPQLTLDDVVKADLEKLRLQNTEKEPPNPSTPREQTHTPSDNQHHSSPTLSQNISISNDAPPSDNPNVIPSPSSPAAPARFTKVTNWETMQRFQYELHMEYENLLGQRDARHYELIQDLSMQVAFLREELARRGPNSGF
nr:hypothetical protein Iba_chr13dCG7080 [Ipomoea batatas]